MRSLLRATAIALTFIASAGVLQAQANKGKIVFVNSQALMDAAPGKSAAQAMLQKEGEALQTQVQKMQDTINAKLAAYQKVEATLSATAKDTKQKELQGLETEFQATQLKLQQQWAQRQNEVMAPVTDVVKKVLDDILIEEGYAMILDNAPGAGAGIVAADKNLDVTDKVVSRLKATPARPMVAPAAAAPATTKPGAPASPAGVQSKPPIKPPVQ